MCLHPPPLGDWKLPRVSKVEDSGLSAPRLVMMAGDGVGGGFPPGPFSPTTSWEPGHPRCADAQAAANADVKPEAGRFA